MNVRALIFDVDGTLAETEEAHRAAFNRTFSDWALGWHWSREAYRQLLRTTGGKERIAAFQATLPAGARRLTADEIARLHRQKTGAYGAILASGGLSLRPGVADLVRAARRAGMTLAVATTTNTPNVEALCRCCWDAPASKVFDHIAAGDMVARKKPAPDVYLLALKQLGLPAAQCLAFEDSANGVASARGAGLRVIATPSAYTDRERFDDADWVLDDLSSHMLPAELTAALPPLAC